MRHTRATPYQRSKGLSQFAQMTIAERNNLAMVNCRGLFSYFSRSRNAHPATLWSIASVNFDGTSQYLVSCLDRALVLIPPSHLDEHQESIHLASFNLIWEHLEGSTGTRIRRIAAENMTGCANVFNISDGPRVDFERLCFGIGAEDTGNGSGRVVGSFPFRTR